MQAAVDLRGAGQKLQLGRRFAIGMRISTFLPLVVLLLPVLSQLPLPLLLLLRLPPALESEFRAEFAGATKVLESCSRCAAAR